jgi:cytochrome b6-f complex iron-sulfur subunit
MADKKTMTVAEMLAAARQADAGGGTDKGAAKGAAEPAPVAKAAAVPKSAVEAPAAAPVAKKPAAPADRSKMSVADMLAAARSGDQGDGAPKAAAPPKEKPAAAAKPAAAPAAAKATPAKKETAAAKAEPVDTQSILTAARKATKPGPMTKAEAAAKAPTPAADAKKAKAKEAIVVPPMPIKPDYAKAAADRGKQEQVRERRAFLFGMSALAVGFTFLAATTAAWTLGMVRFMFPNILREPPSRFTVGRPDQIAPGQVEEKYKAQFGVWVVNTEYNGEPQIFALKSVCTHLGCTPNWLEAEQKFKCPCHGSGFYKDGINFEGPAPRPLERYAISIAPSGEILVDKSHTFQEEMGQWSDPTSFITV